MNESSDANPHVSNASLTVTPSEGRVKTPKQWLSQPREAGTSLRGYTCGCSKYCHSVITERNKVQFWHQWDSKTRSHRISQIALTGHGMSHSVLSSETENILVRKGDIWDRQFWEARQEMSRDINSDLKFGWMYTKPLDSSVSWHYNTACRQCLELLGRSSKDLVQISWTKTNDAPSYIMHLKCLPRSEDKGYATDPQAENYWFSVQNVDHFVPL